MKTGVLERGSGSSRSLDAHQNNGLEIVSLSRGKLLWQVEGRRHIVPPGSIFFTLPWQTHGSVVEFEPGHRWDFVVLRLNMRDLSRPGPFTFDQCADISENESRRICRLLRSQSHHVFPSTPELAGVVSALAGMGRNGNLIKEKALVTLLITGLAELIEKPRSPFKDGPDAYRVGRVVQKLQKNIAHSWTLAEATQLAGLQKSRFCDIFQRETGDTFMHFINRIRVEHSRLLLSTTSRSITQIAHDCGFSSSQYFAKVFRDFTGDSASLFRKKKILNHPLSKIYASSSDAYDKVIEIHRKPSSRKIS